MKNKIPDRWLEYSPMGSKVAGTRFIAFKAPLSKEICVKMKASDRFTPDILMERCPNMRLIIDLTNTDRYYNKQEFIDRGIQYEKIMCPGQVIPPQSLIFRFFEIIDDFYLKNGLKDVLIGIHCTHGVNRTGYFIGRYMVQRMGFHYEKAIPCIEEARGHKIERPNYINDLMIQVPIPSSLSSSTGKKVVDSKSEHKKGPGSSAVGKAGGKITLDRQQKQYRKPNFESREHIDKNARRRTPEERDFRPKAIPVRSANFGPTGGRAFSPGRRGNSPGRRGPSPGRRGFSPNRRISPMERRDLKGPSPKSFRTPPRMGSPRRRSPPRRSPPRRMSPPRREGYLGPSSYREDERSFPKASTTTHRNYSPRRNEPPSGFSSRAPPDNHKSYGPPSVSPWQPPHENRGFNSSATSYGSSSNQYSGSRAERHVWENRPSNQLSFSSSRPQHVSSGPNPWNTTSSSNFSAPPPNVNTPASNFDSRSGGFSNLMPSARFADRRVDDQKCLPPPRDEGRRPWKEDRTYNAETSYNRFEENRRQPERSDDYRSKPIEKFDKPLHRSPPRDYSRDKRPLSPPRDYPRHNMNAGPSRAEAPWERRRSPEPSFSDFNRSGVRKRSRSPVRRESPPAHRSRSPRRRSPPRSSGFDMRPAQRGPSTRGRGGEPCFSSHYDAPPARSAPEPRYQEKGFYENRDDCRDFLNQKRQFEGADRGEFGMEQKAKLDIRGIPKEVDLRKVIRGGNVPEVLLKDRLGPPPREQIPVEASRRYGRPRSRSPRARSPPKFDNNSRRY